jgi:hypothetical protein
MANKTLDDFTAVTVPAISDVLLVSQATIHKKETLAQVDTLLSATAKTLTNKTLTSPVINTGVSGTAIDTDGTMAANSDTLIPSQKAVKTYAQLKDTFLTSLAALGTAANKLLYSAGVDTAAELALTANTFPCVTSSGGIIARSITDFALSLLDDSTAAAFKTTGIAAGDIVQIMNAQTGAVATGTTAMVNDDTIPQKTEGDEYMTLAITPTSATNKLIIIALANLANSNAVSIITALFQDATADALAAVQNYPGAADAMMGIQLMYYMAAGTTSATTFRIRAGGTTGATTTFNGAAGGRKFGAMCISSITIIEVQA